MMPIKPYIAPLIAVTDATRQVTCLIKQLAQHAITWIGVTPSVTLIAIIQLTPPLPRERSKSSEIFQLIRTGERTD